KAKPHPFPELLVLDPVDGPILKPSASDEQWEAHEEWLNDPKICKHGGYVAGEFLGNVVLAENMRNALRKIEKETDEIFPILLDDLKQRGTYFKLRVLESEQAPESTFDGKRVINIASNNYLGLTTHPKLREAALKAIRDYGVGSGAVRTVCGTMRIHMELEEKIARFKNVEACVVFQSGFAANAGTVSAILGKEDFIISDALNHASIIDGARLSKAKILVYRHKDIAHAEEQLA